ncbi:MAG TPA: hypothetical protein VLV83_19555, partial [Acidobacteriota bacterium]|nr:hypothetical protein [Acidobacteriota bacterium]
DALATVAMLTTLAAISSKRTADLDGIRLGLLSGLGMIAGIETARYAFTYLLGWPVWLMPLHTLVALGHLAAWGFIAYRVRHAVWTAPVPLPVVRPVVPFRHREAL